MRKKSAKHLKKGVPGYGTHLSRHADDVTFLNAEETLMLLKDSAPIHIEVGGEQRVLAYGEQTGWILEPRL